MKPNAWKQNYSQISRMALIQHHRCQWENVSVRQMAPGRIVGHRTQRRVCIDTLSRVQATRMTVRIGCHMECHTEVRDFSFVFRCAMCSIWSGRPRFFSQFSHILCIRCALGCRPVRSLAALYPPATVFPPS